MDYSAFFFTCLLVVACAGNDKATGRAWVMAIGDSDPEDIGRVVFPGRFSKISV